jgi:two-component system, OmpR family, sensor histidine kinase KdpD
MSVKQIISTRRVAENLLAILVSGAVTGILFLFRNNLSTPIVGLLFLLPVLGSSTRWGLGAGIIASVCAFLAFNFLFIPPYYTFTVHQTQDLIALVVFLIVAIVISQLIGRIQSSLAKVRAREQEVSRLYDLSTALVALRTIDEVGARLASDLQAVLNIATCRIVIDAESPAVPVTVVSPQGNTETEKPEQITLLKTDRGRLGEIQLWTHGRALSPVEEHLLRAFAGQGALALERAVLAQTETRTQILEESDRLKSALLSSVSHELRTPLVTIKAAVTSLQSGEVSWESAARKELLEALDEEADRLNDLVGNLLNMSRIEAGALKLEQHWNVLAEVVDGAVERLNRATRDHRLQVDVSEELPLVQVDPILLQQVFINLISNSIKYAPKNTTIRIGASKYDDDALLIEVVNEGPPVPVEHLEGIFDRFHRVTAADRTPGVGLGLSICKGIVEAHGGRIWAENLPAGFAFRFTLPNTSNELASVVPLDKI